MLGVKGIRRSVVAALLAMVATFAAAAVPGRADAASLIGDYRFDGNFDSSAGTAPPLELLGSPGTFGSATVDGKPDGAFSYVAGTGLRLRQSAFPDTSDFSTIITVSLAATEDYERILAFDTFDTDGDSGIYTLDGGLGFYDLNKTPANTDFGPPGTVAPSTFADIAFTRSGDNETAGYVNGLPQFTHADPGRLSVIDIDGLRYFRDNGTEHTAGKVARIRVYDGALTAADVQTIEQNGGQAATATTSGEMTLVGKKKSKPKAISTGISLTCPTDGAPCAIGGALVTKIKGKTKNLAELSGTLDPGTTQAGQLSLTRKAKKLLAKRGKLRLGAVATITPPDGVAATASNGRRL